MPLTYKAPDWEGFGRAMVEFEWPATRDVEALAGCSWKPKETKSGNVPMKGTG